MCDGKNKGRLVICGECSTARQPLPPAVFVAMNDGSVTSLHPATLECAGRSNELPPLAALAASAASVDGVDDVDHVNHVGVGGVLPSFGFAASWNAGMGKAMVVRSSGGSGQGEGGGGGGGESKVTSSLKESTDATITIDMMDIVATEHTEHTEHSMHGDSDSAAASSLAQLEAAVGEEGRTLGSAAGPATRRLLRVAAWLEGLEWQRLPVSASSDMAHTLRKTVSHTVLADGGVVVSCSANAGAAGAVGAAGAAGAVGPAGEGGEGGSKDNHLLLVPQGECAVNSLVASIEREGGLDDELVVALGVDLFERGLQLIVQQRAGQVSQVTSNGMEVRDAWMQAAVRFRTAGWPTGGRRRGGGGEGGGASRRRKGKTGGRRVGQVRTPSVE